MARKLKQRVGLEIGCRLLEDAIPRKTFRSSSAVQSNIKTARTENWGRHSNAKDAQPAADVPPGSLGEQGYCGGDVNICQTIRGSEFGEDGCCRMSRSFVWRICMQYALR